MHNKLLSLLFGVLIFSIVFAPQTQAQTEQNKTWLNIFVGHNEYNGDFDNEMFNFDIPNDFGAGIGIEQYLNPSFALDVDVFVSRIDDEFYFTDEYFVSGNALLQYKLANGYLLPERSAFKPFVTAGVGYGSFVDGVTSSPNTTGVQPLPSTSSFEIPVGAGFSIPIYHEYLEFKFKSVYNFTFTDEIDGNTTLDNSDSDNFLVHSIGLKFNLNPAPKDSDNDGIPDDEDRCPAVMGDADTQGCPDMDGDGVIDMQDRCPETAGLAAFSGCPDSDGDKIADYEDQCPNTAGIAKFNGCADSDSDGIMDQNDSCPNVAGSESANGCPDTDVDGIVNSEDQCPNRAGEASNNGCPEVSQEVQDEIDVIFNNLLFTTAEATIDQSSMDEMNQLVTLMQEDENLLLSIEGHTDTRGAADYNQQLSEDRANAVRDYLVNAGIDASRITATGYGESRPLVSPEENETDLARNRRVELIVSYQ